MTRSRATIWAFQHVCHLTVSRALVAGVGCCATAGYVLRTYRGPMRKITTSDRLRYRFDNTMSRGTSALIGWLALISLVLVVVFALIVVLTGIAPDDGGVRPGLGTLLWMSLMHTM